MYIKALVKAGAKREAFSQISEGRFAILVREPAEQNLANRRVRALVAAHFHLSPKKIRIVSGHRSPSKLLSVDAD